MTMMTESTTEGMRTRLAEADARLTEIGTLMGQPDIVTDARWLLSELER